MMDKKPSKATPVPGSVQAKMEAGQRQRYAMATSPSALPKEERVKR